MGDRQGPHVTKPPIGMGTDAKQNQSNSSIGNGGRERSQLGFARVFTGKEFRRMRRLARCTQAHVAERLGCDRRLIGRWEREQQFPPYAALPALEGMLFQFRHEVTEAEHGTQGCSSCKRTLPVSSFAVDRSRRSGRQTQCRGCKSEVVAQWRKKNATQIRRQRKEKRTRQRIQSSGRAAKPHKSRDLAALNEIGEDLRIVKSPPRETIRKPSLILPSNPALERQANLLLQDESDESHETLRERRESQYIRQVRKRQQEGRLTDDHVKVLGRLLNRYVHSPSWLLATSSPN
jgi:hypothetical protein